MCLPSIGFAVEGVLLAAITIPFILPPIVVALGLLSLLGPSGLVNDGAGGRVRIR